MEEFSEIFFSTKQRVHGLITKDPKRRDLNTLWLLEYLVSTMKERVGVNRKLGFAPREKKLETIIFEAKKIIRAEIIRQTKSMSPVAVNLILDSLYALSEKLGFLDFQAFSELTTYNSYGEYLSDQIFGKGRNPPEKYVNQLRSVLIREGISSDHMAVQWAELFLQTKGFKYLDFEFYIDKLKLLSGNRESDTPIIKSGTETYYMALTVTYAMTGGRSWKTGEKLDFDEVMLHHIMHDANGLTFYGVDYENKYEYFACLKKDGENREVEKASEKRYWENTFANMWSSLKSRDYGALRRALAHWENDLMVEELITELQSSRYLDKWLGML